jgi:hypothetical protein
MKTNELKIIEKQELHIAYLQGVIRALRLMSMLKETSLNIESEKKFKSEISALKSSMESEKVIKDLSGEKIEDIPIVTSTDYPLNLLMKII